MGFLILDTDKRSTHSLRLQLDAIGNGPVREVSEPAEYGRLRARRLPPPFVIFLDQDGDPERIEMFRQELEAVDPGSAVVYLGTESASRWPRSQDSYLRKPVFRRKLERAVVESYARGQELRSGVGYLGGPAPVELVRDLPYVPRLWRQIGPVEPKLADPGLLGTLGVLFIILSAEPLKPGERELIERIHRFTSASRILLVGVGVSPGETRELRNLADYFVPADADWKAVLRALANRRFSRLGSELGLRRARQLFAEGRLASCERSLRRVLRDDPWNLCAHGKLADLHFSRGRYKAAEAGYRRILELNPCQPRAYLRILEIERREIERRTKSSHSEATLERALSYCPKVPQLQTLLKPGVR